MSKRPMLNNKWKNGRSSFSFDIPSLKERIRKNIGFSTVLAVPGMIDESVGTEASLLWIDSTPFVHKLASLKPFHFVVKTGAYETSYGPIFYVLFIAQLPDGPEPLVTVETFINPDSPQMLLPYYDLARQTHWHLFILDKNLEVLNWLEFENIYSIQRIKSMRWSPDGKKLGLLVFDKGHGSFDEITDYSKVKPELYIYDLKTKKLSKLMDCPDCFDFHFVE